MTFTRQSVLNDRHRSLGSDLSTGWNDMPLPQNYATDPYDETAAVRCRAGLFDVSSLKIVNVTGSEAQQFLNYLLTSNISAAKPGDSHISNIVNEEGGLIDDVLVYVDSPDQYRVSHGGGAFEEAAAAAKGRFKVDIERDNDVHILSLQGPLALEILSRHTPMNIAALEYFKHGKTTVFGKPVSIGRGGYAGERGYEVFCSAVDAHHIWDSILAAGKDAGVMPVSWSCLDIVRVEAGLLFFPFDMTNKNTTPWEVKADWTVDLNKPDFIGKKALAEKKGKERSFITGVEVNHSEAIAPGASVRVQGKDVGVVASSTYSRHLMKSLVMAQVVPEFIKLGTQVEIVDGKTYPGLVVQTPFYDPMRLRTHGKD